MGYYSSRIKANALDAQAKGKKKDIGEFVNADDMYKELKSELGCKVPNNGNLVPWARQGVLMLNAVLTVRAHTPNSHKDQGWEQFTDAVIKAVSAKSDHVVFVLWGAYHGLLLVVFRAGFWDRLYTLLALRLRLRPLVDLMRWLGFFHLVCLGWVLFRAASLGECGVILGKLLDPRGWQLSAWLAEVAASGEARLLALWALVLLALLLVQVAGRVGSEVWAARLWRAPPPLRFVLLVALFYACVLLAPEAPQPFIYFQF